MEKCHSLPHTRADLCQRADLYEILLGQRFQRFQLFIAEFRL
jgi:hypothetical protein